ncbi:hypothetical protein [Stutzerimonas nitrititolerans]|uniref:hypothetical protein n=1 Tax=Stutzerimonas nitrititolerans TaxID=2482751 RepID=UPI0028B11331|nr:hypothetical protein [Stutzerimonas nitrititolerans]
MNNPIIIVAAQGAGKTTHAQGLKAAFGCARIVDDWDGITALSAGDLALTSCDAFQPPKRARVMSLNQALSEAKLVA